jgi:chromosome segregation ATPase
MVEIILILTGFLFAITIGAALEYYRQLRSVKKEYEKARDTLKDVILSFNRELRQEAERVEVIAYKLEAISAKSKGITDKIRSFGKKLDFWESKAKSMKEDNEELLLKFDLVEKELRDVIKSQKMLETRISKIEEKTESFPTAHDGKVEAVIPIKREKAIAPLTETELTVLEMLSSEGPKTAPEIKKRIKLSREHTARLMKKLYEEGYLERETSKIPFKYRIKKEMEKILKKAES